MERVERFDETYQEGRVRISWNRHDVYQALRAMVRGPKRIHQRHVAFLDREDGVHVTVPRVLERVAFVPWPRSAKTPDLAHLSMSLDRTERRAGLAVVATTAAGTVINLAERASVYFLSGPDQEGTEVLDQPIPLGELKLTRSMLNWTTSLADLRRATTCADLRSAQTVDAGVDDDDSGA